MDPAQDFLIEDEYILSETSLKAKPLDDKPASSKLMIPVREYKSKVPSASELNEKDQSLKEAEDFWIKTEPFENERFKKPEPELLFEPIQIQKNKEGLLKIPESPYKAKRIEEQPAEEFGRRSRSFRGRYRVRESNRPRNEVLNKVENEKSENAEVSWPMAANSDSNSQSNEEFSVKTYKTQKCTVGDKCKGCNRYHYEGEKRRDIEKNYYYPVICPRGNNCPNIEKCSKAHNFVELYYHPQIYRSTACPLTVKFKQCALGNFCNCLHLVDDLGKMKCKVCGKEDMDFVRDKCGHPCCKKCSSGGRCLKCGVDAVSIKVNFS